MKQCKLCGQLKPLSEYHTQRTNKDGLDKRCKPCRKTLAAEEYKNKWFKNTFILKRSYCKQRNIPFDLTPEYLESIWTDKCPVFGFEFEKHNKISDKSPALDRLNPKFGYIKGNVVYISARANRIKYDATVEELRRIADWLEGATTRSKDRTLK